MVKIRSSSMAMIGLLLLVGCGVEQRLVYEDTTARGIHQDKLPAAYDETPIYNNYIINGPCIGDGDCAPPKRMSKESK